MKRIDDLTKLDKQRALAIKYGALSNVKITADWRDDHEMCISLYISFKDEALESILVDLYWVHYEAVAAAIYATRCPDAMDTLSKLLVARIESK